TRIRTFAQAFLDEKPGGTPLQRSAQVGFGADGKWSSFTRLELNRDEIRAGGRLIQRFRPRLELDASPSRAFGNLQFIGYFGDEIDFANARKGTGTNLSFAGTWRPEDHTAVSVTTGLRWLDVNDASVGSGCLFTAPTHRAPATSMFNVRCFARPISQYVQHTRNRALYTPFTPRSKAANLSLSGLFAYKLNSQTVFYAGYGDTDTYSNATGELEKDNRQAFAKVSYAWQH